MRLTDQKTVSVLALVLGILLLSSCDVQQPIETGETDRISINSDADALSERVDIIDEPVSSSQKGASASEANFTHIANVRTPVEKDGSGRQLSATGVHIRGDFAYVSYHLNGVDYDGAIDIIDISDPDNPQIVANLAIGDTDFNDVTLDGDGSHLYIAGGREQSSSGYEAEGHNGAIAGEIELQNGNSFTQNMREEPLRSFSGNSIEISGDNLVVATGGTGGGVYSMDRQSFTVQGGIDQDLARHVDIEGDEIVGLALNVDSENTAELYRFNANNNTVETLDTGLTIRPEDGKNVIDLRNGLVYTALSDQGFKVYDFSNPSGSVGSFSPNGSGLANGLDAGDNFLYMAAGSEGLYVASLPDLESVFQFDNSQGSANYVESDGEFIFLAKGIDGLNILRRNDGGSSQALACPFDANDGTVVEFQNNRISSDEGEAESQTDLASVNLAAGTYRVKLFGYDDHRNDNFDRQQQNQPNESFYISLLADGNEIATTDELGDLNDDNDLATRTEVIDSFELNSSADQVRAVHAAYPDNSNPNSMNAKCVAFEQTN